jgi:hypothetical protein
MSQIHVVEVHPLHRIDVNTSHLERSASNFERGKWKTGAFQHLVTGKRTSQSSNSSANCTHQSPPPYPQSNTLLGSLKGIVLETRADPRSLNNTSCWAVNLSSSMSSFATGTQYILSSTDTFWKILPCILTVSEWSFMLRSVVPELL